MIRKLLIKALDYFLCRIGALAISEERRIRKESKINIPSQAMYITDEMFKERIKKLPPKLLLLEVVWFYTTKFKIAIGGKP